MKSHGVSWAWALLLAGGLGCSDSTDGSDGTAPALPGPAGNGVAGSASDAPMAPAADNGSPQPSGDGAASTPPAGPSDPAATQPGDGTAQPTQPGGAGDGAPFALDECDLDTGFTGDEQCILPPPPGQGFQLRIGPDDYDNPDPMYVLEPGEEITNDFVVTSGNTEDVFFYYRQYRLRPSSHHMIISAGSGGLGGRRIGTANLSQDNPRGGMIAPENEGVGIELAANSRVNVSLHSINVTDQPVLREVWVNFWYRDIGQVSEPTNQLFEIGSASFAIQPGEDTILGPYSCDIPGNGRMLWFYGHRHANNVRFSAWRVRGGQRDLFYEAFEWEEPLLLEYSSLVENPVPNRDNHVEGGWSGILDLQPGDKLEWECHVINGRDTVLRFTNATYDGEMCIMDGEIVGTDCASSAGGGFGPGGFAPGGN